ncbi:MAG: Cys-tRNA(Pro) deacylase [bacterium]|nr:Cys-tRNA(Pro) deacylase [bacterium]
MTPAINVLEKSKAAHRVHRYAHDPASEAYGPEAAEKLGVPEARIFKTLVVSLGKKLAVGVVPVSSMLNMKLIAKAAGAKKAAMADPSEVQRSTGYVMGGVSPLGQKRRLPTIIDSSAEDYPTIYVSAGRRGLQIELSPEDLRRLTGGTFAEVAEPAGEAAGIDSRRPAP